MTETKRAPGWPLKGTLAWTPVAWTLTVAGALYCAMVLLGVVPYGGCEGTEVVMCDGAAYYFAPDDPYRWDLRPDGVAPYRYSPAFLVAFAPFRLLPWEVFMVVWFGLHVAAFIWLRSGWMLAVPGLNDDVIRGNVTVFLAVAVVIAVTRTAAAWMPVLLTKVTPGIGVFWHLARREWSSFGIALAATAMVIAVGLIASPADWREWVRTLMIGESTYEVGHPLGPLALRLGIAALLVGYAGLTSRAWLLPVGMVIAAPGLWPFNLVLLAAIPRLRSDGHRA